MHITTIIPCLNEELTIAKLIHDLKKLNLPMTVITVDNGSTDKTFEKALEMGSLVFKEPKPGKGAAFRRGLMNLPKETTHVFMVDGDGTYSVSELQDATSLILEHGYDMVIGKRVDSSPSKDQERAITKVHQIGNFLLTKLFQSLFNLNISDSLSGWRLMSRRFVNTFPGLSDGFQLEAELNAHVESLNIQFIEIPVNYNRRPDGSSSKLRTYRDGFKILISNIQMFKKNKPSKAYPLMALPWLVTSILLAYRVFEQYFNDQTIRFPSLVVSSVTTLIAIILWSTGMILQSISLQNRIELMRQYRISGQDGK